MSTVILVEQNISLYKALFEAAHDAGFPAAFWRLPSTNEVHFTAALSGKTDVLKIDLEELPAGFAFSPFHNPDGTHTHFIKSDVHCTIGEGQLVDHVLQKNAGSAINSQEFWLAVQQKLDIHQKHTEDKTINKVISYQPSSTEERDYFTEAVARGRRAIASGTFQKVVVSRTKEVELPDGFNPLDTFAALCNHYPKAFVSCVAIPGMGIWMGASPETLISIDKHQVFRTVSLAGTQPYFPQIPVSRAVWTQKEIEEQALVCRYIVSCFKKIRLREYDEAGPKTVVAGNLMHLRTDFAVDMNAVHFPQLGTVMLELLHPTSAVCGMPKEAAMAFIQIHEPHDRAFYSGFLGPVNIAQETHLFVNLRCMQIQVQKAILYAGAGVTADSNPEREWAETELKCQTLLNVLQKAVL